MTYRWSRRVKSGQLPMKTKTGENCRLFLTPSNSAKISATWASHFQKCYTGATKNESATNSATLYFWVKKCYGSINSATSGHTVCYPAGARNVCVARRSLSKRRALRWLENRVPGCLFPNAIRFGNLCLRFFSSIDCIAFHSIYRTLGFIYSV